MQPFYSSLTALAVAGIYIAWRTIELMRSRRQQILNERVAFMLWRVAHEAD